MDDESLASVLPSLLHDLWDIDATSVRPLGGGMNSATALVETAGGARFVAKWSSDVGSLERGCAAAARLGADGMSTGEPVRTSSNAMTTPVANGALALLRHVPGRELSGDIAPEQVLIGSTLAKAHSAGGPGRNTGPFMTEWLAPRSEVLAVADWLQPAFEHVQREYDALPPLTWSQLHTDPTPEAFIHDDDTGVTGLIDWAGSCRGPVLYDIASVVMYLGGPVQSERFLSSYVADGPLEETELASLDTFRRLRWAIQASYFAGRIAADDQTGIAGDPEHNRESLTRARRGLEETALRRPVR